MKGIRSDDCATEALYWNKSASCLPSLLVMKISDLLRLCFGKSIFKLLPISASFLYIDAVSITHTLEFNFYVILAAYEYRDRRIVIFFKLSKIVYLLLYA